MNRLGATICLFAPLAIGLVLLTANPRSAAQSVDAIKTIPAKQVKVLDPRTTIPPSEIGLHEAAFEIPPLTHGEMLMIYQEVWVGDEYSRRHSKKTTYIPDKPRANKSIKITLSLFNPNHLLPPDLKTKQLKLELGINGGASIHWIDYAHELNGGLNTTANRPISLRDDRPSSLGEWSFDRWVPIKGEPFSQRSTPEVRVHLYCEQRPIDADTWISLQKNSPRQSILSTHEHPTPIRDRQP